MSPQETPHEKKSAGPPLRGLDSTLAVRVMLEHEIEVEALNFTSPFCTCTSKSAGCTSDALDRRGKPYGNHHRGKQ